MDNHNFTLDNLKIVDALKEIESWLEKHSVEHKIIVQLMLSVEELLLRWQDHFGVDKNFTLIFGYRFKQPYIALHLEGEEWNPMLQSDEEVDWSKRILTGLGLAPEYTYRNGVNKLFIRVTKKKKSSMVAILIAVAAAVLCGICGNVFLSENTTVIIAEYLISPVRVVLLNLISAVAVPMVFLSVVLGICEVGNVSEFGKLGNRLMLRYVRNTAVLSVVFAVIVFSMFSLNYEDVHFSMQQVAGTFQMILDIFPKNFVEPFYTGNTLQVIVIAVVIGFALLVLGDRVNEIKIFAQKMYFVVELLLQWVCKLIVPVVFVLLLELIWTSDLLALAGLWKPLLITLSAICILWFLSLIYIVQKYNIKPAFLLKKLFPVILIAFTTSSSAVALSEGLECCEKKLGIQKKITAFGMPIGSLIYRPTIAMQYFVCVLYGAEYFDVSCSGTWLFLGWLTASLLAIATPPFPGGSYGVYTIIFLQMGIPSEAIVFAIAMDFIVDRFATTSNFTMLHLQLIRFADKHGFLDYDTLKK